VYQYQPTQRNPASAPRKHTTSTNDYPRIDSKLPSLEHIPYLTCGASSRDRET
jgi:hypothetical protein